MRRRRSGAAAIVAALAAIALAGCGGGGHRAAARAAPPTLTVHSALVSAGSARSAALLRSAALRHLQAVTVNAVRHSGPDIGILVQDLTTGQILFTRNAGVARAPASVEKLYTSIAVLQLLGPNARLHTDVLGTGHLGRGGVWHGDLYLRGDGDPTFGDGTFNRIYEDGFGPTAAQVVAQLRHDGIHRVAGHLIADESRFDDDRGGPATRNRPDLPDYGGELSALVYDHGATAKGYSPATFAANELALTARSEGVGLFSSGRAGRTPGGARLLATVASPPMSVLLKLMDVPSDDLFAELLAKQLGYRFAHLGTLAAGAGVIGELLASRFRLHPRVLDGSGLDKADRSSPEELVDFLREVWRTPIGAELADALPMVGESGTVRDIGVHTAARGRCAAKTGTLDDVTNLAGYCAARGGHTLAFTVMIDGPENWQAVGTIGTIVGAIAGY